MARKPPPLGELAGVGVPGSDVHRVIAGANEFAGRADGRQHRHVHLGAVAAVDVIDQLVQVVRERVLRVGALVQLGQHVALDREDRRPGARELKFHVVLPLDLVAEMILVRGLAGSLIESASLATPKGRPPVSS